MHQERLRDSNGIQGRGKVAISASFGRPGWKLACWHIFQLCATKEACDHEATESSQSHQVQGQTSLTTKKGLTEMAKVRRGVALVSHIAKQLVTWPASVKL